VGPLRTVEPTQRQILGDEAPLVIIHITRTSRWLGDEGRAWPSLLVPNSRANYMGRSIAGSRPYPCGPVPSSIATTAGQEAPDTPERRTSRGHQWRSA
jgi:hypothetical protein